MPLTKLEKTTLGVLSDVAIFACETAKAQHVLTKLLTQKLPNLSEAEKQEMLAPLAKAEVGRLHLQESATKLKALL